MVPGGQHAAYTSWVPRVRRKTNSHTAALLGAARARWRLAWHYRGYTSWRGSVSS